MAARYMGSLVSAMLSAWHGPAIGYMPGGACPIVYLELEVPCRNPHEAPGLPERTHARPRGVQVVQVLDYVRAARESRHSDAGWEGGP